MRALSDDGPHKTRTLLKVGRQMDLALQNTLRRKSLMVLGNDKSTRRRRIFQHLLKLSLLIFVVHIISGCISEKTSNDSSATSGGIGSGSIRWNNDLFPLQLRVADNFTQQEIDAVEDMAKEWDVAVEHLEQFFEDYELTDNKVYANTSQYRDSEFGVYRLHIWPSNLNEQALAVAQLYGQRVNVGTSNEFIQINHYDIFMNYDHYDFTTSDSSVSGHYDFATVMIHELGHALGLQHTSFATPSVMHPHVSTSDRKREATDLDRTLIANTYNIDSSYATFQSDELLAYHQAMMPSQDPLVQAGLYAQADEERYNGEELELTMELMSDGSCYHHVNGKLTHVHHVDL